MNRALAVIALVAAAAACRAASLPENIVDKVTSACVLIQVVQGEKGSTGSGFFVGRGDILTNCHVIKAATGGDAKITLVLGRNAKEHKLASAELVSYDDELDLALLRTQEKSSHILSFLPERSLRVTQPVWVAGFPFGAKAGLELTLTTGTISSLRHDEKGQLRIVQIDAAVNPGNSGGPVVDEAGRVVGVARAMINPAVGSGMAIAIPCGLAKNFVEVAQRVQRRTAALHVSGRAIRRGVRITGAEKVEETWGTSLRLTLRGTRGAEEAQPFLIEVTDPRRDVLKRDAVTVGGLGLHEEKTIIIPLRNVEFKSVAGCQILD